MRKLLLALLFCSALFLDAGLALAVPVEIHVLGPSYDGNFHYSYTHTADWGDGTYAYGGIITSELSGTLHGDLSGQVLTIDGGSLGVVGASGYASGTMTLAGRLDFGDADGDGLLGKLRYELQEAGGGSQIGDWYFFDEEFSSAAQKPNGLYDDKVLRLWGNNWHNAPGVLVKSGLGIDIGATVNPVPEPQSIALFVLGGALVGGAVWRGRPS